MKRWKTQLTAAAACALLFSFGAVASAAEGDLDDFDVTLAVQTELILEDAVPSHKIDVSTDNGIVTLSGSVDSYYAKLEAEDAAESVKGVLAVINDIDVEPLARLDSQIRGDVVSALVTDPVAESFEIDVSVDDENVRMTGEVDSYAEKTAAKEVAQGVKGVIDVENDLTYDLVADRADADVKEDVEYRLKTDASIDAGLITVKVKDGKITLDGSVGSAVEKSEAETEAWIVPGVKSVANKLDVKWWLDGGPAEWEDEWADADIEQAIDNALLTNPRVSSFNVVTTVDDGVATLTGTVDNLLAKRAAEEEAEDILGVRRVKNYLRVRPALSRTDTEIVNDVRQALRRDPYVDRYDIAVSVYNGDVHLGGEVDSWYMKNQAEEAAAGVRGVVDVQNNLDVDYEYTAKTDREIKDDIEGQLFWSPFVDSDDITVEVHSGVATLMGSVEDWDELQAAKKNARDGGATSVITKLDIENGFGAG
jgi:osmotically-inducible protein OsmY